MLSKGEELKLNQLAKVGVFVGGVGVMILPVITRSHIYRVLKAQPDLSYHGGLIDAVTKGEPIGDTSYLGEVIVSWVLGMINRV